MSFLDGYTPPTTDDIRAALNAILGPPRPTRLPLVDDSGFEAAGVDMGRCADDDQAADRAADREWAARWER